MLAFFGPGYRISVQDMQLVCDVCPLRIDSIFVREVQDGDLLVQQNNGAKKKPVAPAAAANNNGKIAAVLSICVLDSNQPVRITEAEVVRVRKRSRGLLSSLFG